MVGRRLFNPLVIVTILLWAAVYALLTARASLISMPSAYIVGMVRIVTCSFGALSCAWLYLTLQPINRHPLTLQLCVAFFIAFMGAIAWTIVNFTLMDIFVGSPSEEPVTISDMLPTVNLLFWVYLAWCFVYFSLEFRTQLVDRELDLAKAREMALDAQNRMLRYQLNPHFLFNTLNALSALVIENRRDQAEHVLLALSRFLRYSLEQDPTSKTQLAGEIAAQEEYMAIEQIRFGEKLRYVKSVQPEALKAVVPCFILQPAVENAIKYAVSPSTHPVTIELSAHIRGGQLVLGIKDDGTNEKSSGKNGLGVGLENVRRRLELIYGSAATMNSHFRDGGGFEVELHLPLEHK